MRIPDSVFYKIFQYTDIQNLLDGLSVGEMFEGRVLSVSGDFLCMELLDGSRITAQVESGEKYNAGDIIKLKVVEKHAGKLVAAEAEHYRAENGETAVVWENRYFPVQNGTTATKETEYYHAPLNGTAKETGHARLQNDVIGHGGAFYEKTDNPAEILKSLNIPVNKLNTDIVRAVIEMGGKPDAEIIEKAANLIKNSGLSIPKHAVFLVLNKIEDNEHFQDIIRDLDDGKFRFNKELDNLTDLLEKAGEETGDETFSAFAGRIKAALENSLIKTSQVRKNTLRQNQSAYASGSEFVKTEEKEEVGIPRVDRWIDSLKKELSLLERFVAGSSAGDREKILSAVNRLERAIDFFTELQGIEMFVQIPLIIRDSRVGGDLYIMKRSGRRGRINTRDFTLFLSLSTDNIGLLDIFVHVKNKNVMVKILAENESFSRLFIDEYKSLYDALKEKGYNLFNMDFKLKDEKVDIFNVVKKVSELLSINSAKIDVKV